MDKQKNDEVKLLKGVVNHKLKFRGENITLALLRYCVLKTLKTTHVSDIYRTYRLQKNLRNQYCRMRRKEPENRYAYTYALNCCPVGFEVNPVTRFCNNPKACPWCFVRRWLYPTYLALADIPKDIRHSCQVIAWRRSKAWDPKKLLFLRSDYGPHQWCSALATVQLCVPSVGLAENSLQVRHVGVQIVPSDCDAAKQLHRAAVNPELVVTSFKGGTNTNIIRAMATVLRFSWATLFASNNLQSFRSLLTRSDNHLLRITQYKQQGETNNGN
jgi:hypothetical protein